MERKWGINFIRVASVFGLLGVFIGSQMAGEMDYSIRPIHTHVLLVGWLSMFAWGIFYSVYTAGVVLGNVIGRSATSSAAISSIMMLLTRKRAFYFKGGITSPRRLCMSVTVAFSLVRSLATGWPTMWERPITATSFPSREPVCLSSSIMPSGVHGTKVR